MPQWSANTMLLPDGGPMIYAKNTLREPPHRCAMFILLEKWIHLDTGFVITLKFGPSCAFISLKHPYKVRTHSLLMILL